jgi:hypothetical protein
MPESKAWIEDFRRVFEQEKATEGISVPSSSTFSEVSVETCVYSQDMCPAIVSVCSDIGTRDTEIAGAVGQTPTLTI